MAKPAIIPIEPSEEADISRTPLWDPSGAAGGKRGSKGKERDLSDGFGETTELVESPVHSSYPPTNDEEEESRRVQETLKRWEAAELQRRKTARMSSTASSSASPSLVDNVSRRATLLLSGGRSHTSSNSTSSKSGGNRKSNSISGDPSLGVHARLPTQDDSDVLPLTAIPASPTPSPSRSRSASDATVVQHLEDDPFNPLEVQAVVVNSPFADPLPNTSTLNVPSTQAIMQEESQTSALVPLTPRNGTFDGGAGTGTAMTTRQPPPALPLGLPPPITPPPPLDSPSPEPRSREEEEEVAGDVKPTRWWHEWLCGCGEGRDRGGDHQAGRTNPFE
ncbi:hypothetical protein BKA70DRAFT_1259455 [Coprinopsis sp. MPI-PUGE-AT-0042]|nr:hypothetical protein BKA70DRAFT_1259455 [Coprinopsis sp. MPI-PUGE-AT-0042]